MLKSLGSFRSRRQSNFHSPSRTAKSGSSDSGVPGRSGGRRQNSGLERLASETPQQRGQQVLPIDCYLAQRIRPRKTPQLDRQIDGRNHRCPINPSGHFLPHKPRPPDDQMASNSTFPQFPFRTPQTLRGTSPACGPLSLAIKIKVFPRKRGSPFTRSNSGLSCASIVCRTA